MFSPTVDALGQRVIACLIACFELSKKPDEEIAREAQAYHTLRKRNRGRRKPVTLRGTLKGTWG